MDPSLKESQTKSQLIAYLIRGLTTYLIVIEFERLIDGYSARSQELE